MGLDQLSDRSLVLVLAVALDDYFFPKDEGRGGVRGVFAVGLVPLRAVDPAETDTFRLLIVQDFDGIAVENEDDWAGEVIGKDGQVQREQQ